MATISTSVQLCVRSIMHSKVFQLTMGDMRGLKSIDQQAMVEGNISDYHTVV